MSRVGLIALALGGAQALGCATKRTAPVPPSTEAAPQCREPIDKDLLAVFDGSPCSWVLLRGPGSRVRLGTLDLEPPEPIAGDMPAACAAERCRFTGTSTTLGPVVVAVRDSPVSEMPEGVHLGVVVHGRGLVFVDLWGGAGEPVMGDATPLGPAHALVPASCPDGLGLFVGERLPAARAVEPAPELIAREGVYALDGAGSELRPTKSDRSKCEPLALELP